MALIHGFREIDDAVATRLDALFHQTQIAINRKTRIHRSLLFSNVPFRAERLELGRANNIVSGQFKEFNGRKLKS
jgi:hypothetical protein